MKKVLIKKLIMKLLRRQKKILNSTRLILMKLLTKVSEVFVPKKALIRSLWRQTSINNIIMSKTRLKIRQERQYLNYFSPYFTHLIPFLGYFWTKCDIIFGPFWTISDIIFGSFWAILAHIWSHFLFLY